MKSRLRVNCIKPLYDVPMENRFVIFINSFKKDSQGKINPSSFAILPETRPNGLSKPLLCVWMSRRFADHG
jgi:hypothetical protein